MHYSLKECFDLDWIFILIFIDMEGNLLGFKDWMHSWILKIAND